MCVVCHVTVVRGLLLDGGCVLYVVGCLTCIGCCNVLFDNYVTIVACHSLCVANVCGMYRMLNIVWCLLALCALLNIVCVFVCVMC